MKMVTMANTKATEVKVPQDPGSNPAVGPSPLTSEKREKKRRTQIT